MVHAIFYVHQTSGVCADMCACDCMYQMKKTEVLPHKQCKVKLNGLGCISLHNKRFLCHITSQSNINHIPSATVTIPTTLTLLVTLTFKENTPPPP